MSEPKMKTWHAAFDPGLLGKLGKRRTRWSNDRQRIIGAVKASGLDRKGRIIIGWVQSPRRPTT